MRQAFDWLRDTVAPRYEAEAKKLFENPWQTRDAYIDVILDRSRENVIRFMNEQAKRELSQEETIHGTETAGTAALSNADVHQLWMVL